jgi:pimeloyl-ACP methyl ester carboxylesterase
MKGKSNSIPKKPTFEVPKDIIRTGKVLQFFSKSLATSFALKLFSRPPLFNTPERELMMRESAKNELVLIPAIVKEVMVYVYGYSKTKILLTHGWSGRGTQLYDIADKLLENGMMVISFDAPAHGLSSGKTTDLLEYVAAIHYINEKYGPFEAAIGHSFGGIALLDAQAKNPFVNKLITIGLASSINSIVDEFVKKLGLKPVISTKVKRRMHTILKRDIETSSAVENAKKITIPTLVLHDTQDVDVDVSSAYRIRQNLAKGELLVTNGLGHRRIFRDQKVIDKIIDFIKDN